MNEKNALNWEVSVGVTFASLMAAVSLFFTGVLIAQFNSFDVTIRVPLLFLIVSTFSYIFAASIYSNAGEEITVKNEKKVQKYLVYANNIFEFTGLYLLILATPLVIGAVTHDNFLRIATIGVALSGLTLYSLSDFSMLHKEIRTALVKNLLTLVLVLAAGLLYLSQYVEQASQSLIYNYVATFILSYLIVLAYYFCRKSKQYKID